MTIVRGHYGLPAALAATVRETRDALEAGLPGLDTNNVRDANARLQVLRNDLRDAAGGAGRDWVDKTAGVADALGQRILLLCTTDRDVALDPGRATAPRIVVPHMLPSGE